MPEITSITTRQNQFTSLPLPDPDPAHLPPGGKILFPGGGRFTSRNDLPFPWVQYIGRSPGWIGDLVIGNGDSRSALVIDVPYEDGPNRLHDIIRYVLGWSFKVPGTSNLSRKIPWRNPWLPWHTAFALPHVDGVKPLGAAQGPLGPFPVYRLWRATIGFRSEPYQVMTDDELSALPDPGEWLRWTSHRRQGQAHALSRETGSFRFLAGPGLNTDVRGSIQQTLFKTTHLFKWHGVPSDGLFPATGRSPLIDAAVGCVNETDWYGFPAGTLLLEAPTFDPILLPALILGAGGKVQTTTLPLAFDVTFPLIEFDPPRGTWTGLPIPAWRQRGHNLLPNVTDNLWYPVGPVDGAQPLYPSYEFRNLWKMN